MTREQKKESSSPTPSSGACVLLCETGAKGGPVPPAHLLDALHARGIRTIPLADPTLAMAALVRLSAETSGTPAPLLFIACSLDTGPLAPLIEAIAQYCPRVVSRRLDPDAPSRIAPFDSDHRTEGRRRGAAHAKLNGKPDLRLAGADAATPKHAEDFTHEGVDERTTLSDEELSMLLSDDWERRADGTRS